MHSFSKTEFRGLGRDELHRTKTKTSGGRARRRRRPARARGGARRAWRFAIKTPSPPSTRRRARACCARTAAPRTRGWWRPRPAAPCRTRSIPIYRILPVSSRCPRSTTRGRRCAPAARLVQPRQLFLFLQCLLACHHLQRRQCRRLRHKRLRYSHGFGTCTDLAFGGGGGHNDEKQRLRADRGINNFPRTDGISTTELQKLAAAQET